MGAGEPAGDDQSRMRWRTRENDFGLPFSHQLPACGNGSLEPIGPHIGNMDQPEIVTAKDLPKRPRRSSILRGRVLAAVSGVERCSAAQ